MAERTFSRGTLAEATARSMAARRAGIERSLNCTALSPAACARLTCQTFGMRRVRYNTDARERRRGGCRIAAFACVHTDGRPPQCWGHTHLLLYLRPFGLGHGVPLRNSRRRALVCAHWPPPPTTLSAVQSKRPPPQDRFVSNCTATRRLDIPSGRRAGAHSPHKVQGSWRRSRGAMNAPAGQGMFS